METALSTITVLPSSFQELAMYEKKIESEILADKRDGLEILKQFAFLEKLIENLRKNPKLEEYFLSQAYKFNQKTFEHKNCEFTIGEVGVKYDYAASGDPVWSDLSKQLEELKEKVKAREKVLQNAQEGFVEPKTGVYVNAAPRTSKTKVIVKLKK